MNNYFFILTNNKDLENLKCQFGITRKVTAVFKNVNAIGSECLMLRLALSPFNIIY